MLHLLLAKKKLAAARMRFASSLSQMPQVARSQPYSVTLMQDCDRAAHLNSLMASDCCAHAMGLIQYTQIHQPGTMCFGWIYAPASRACMLSA